MALFTVIKVNCVVKKIVGSETKTGATTMEAQKEIFI